jgi:hypothetical protein
MATAVGFVRVFDLLIGTRKKAVDCANLFRSRVEPQGIVEFLSEVARAFVRITVDHNKMGCPSIRDLPIRLQG